MQGAVREQVPEKQPGRTGMRGADDMALGPAGDFFLPRLQALIAEGEKEGISADVAVAVLLDLLDTENLGVTSAPEGGTE